ncbi:MAG: fluoride efflux transporter CrcB [Euryarchaeota archaeon]|jgi:CrcB protein|nr:fluoride efflux transporter CrcB [Euryarchaeota archaeon]MBF14743.1 fluoride efflux transporter CrcB [Euryarchaeota archaeon]MDP6866553.1 fluoride efflux transporter CrcB [Candidatus Poseidoniaceae archaeon]CAI8322921.1 MAG: Putative fluoride ion transporter CrcB [Euryarchaeota archaeon UBA443]|tara:strand:+ start:77 stop:454 length:378 start_codon:yes stop_codon:yes gene_type:complete
MFQQVLMVALGGGIGAALRYLTSEWVSNDGFPWATLCVNLVGSFLMGAVAIGLAEQVISKDMALLLGTGLLGGLTTMSAFSIETIQLIEDQQTGLAAGYVGLTMLLCPLLALLGWKLSETILGST